MTRILFIIPKTEKGGAEVQLLSLLKNIDRKKFEPYLGLLYGHGTMKKDYESLGIEIVDFRKKTAADLSIYFRISRYIKRMKIDIVQSFMGNHHAAIPCILAKRGIAVGNLRNTRYSELSFFGRFRKYSLLRILNKIRPMALVSCSHVGANLYKKNHVTDTIVTIPNGIDYKKYSSGNKEKITREFNLKDYSVLSITGRLIESKNHIFLLDLVQRLSKEYKIKLLVAGTGPLLARLRDFTRDMDNIFILGSRTDIPDILAATDIFPFPSGTEAWPNSVGEAMAAGIPVVSTPVGDVPKIITDGKDGIIADMGEIEGKIKMLLENSKLRKKIGAEAKNKIKNNYSIEKMVKAYERFYEGLI